MLIVHDNKRARAQEWREEEEVGESEEADVSTVFFDHQNTQG